GTRAPAPSPLRPSRRAGAAGHWRIPAATSACPAPRLRRSRTPPRPAVREESSDWRSSGAFARHDGHPHGVAPFGPRSVVIAHTGLAQQMREHEPGVAGPLADAAIDDGFVVGVEETVELLELLAAAE